MLIKSYAVKQTILVNLEYEAVGSNPYHLGPSLLGWIHQNGRLRED